MVFRVFGSFSCVYISVYTLGVKVGDLEKVCGGFWDVNGIVRGPWNVNGRDFSSRVTLETRGD